MAADFPLLPIEQPARVPRCPICHQLDSVEAILRRADGFYFRCEPCAYVWAERDPAPAALLPWPKE